MSINHRNNKKKNHLNPDNKNYNEEFLMFDNEEEAAESAACMARDFANMSHNTITPRMMYRYAKRIFKLGVLWHKTQIEKIK